MHRPLFYVTLTIIAACSSNTARPPEASTTSTNITRDGVNVGVQEREVRETDSGRELIWRQKIQVKVADTKTRWVIEEETRIEDLQQNTIAIEHRSRVGSDESLTSAKIVGDTAIVRRTSRDDSRETDITLPAGTRFDNGSGLMLDRSMTEWSEMEFFALDIRAPLIERIVYSPTEPRRGSDESALLRKVYVDEKLRSVSTLYFDPSGALVGSNQPMFGRDLVANDPSAEQAAAVANNPVRASLKKSPYRISRAAMNGHLRYTFGVDADTAFQPPQTSEQRVTLVDGGFVLDICDACGPGLDQIDGDLDTALKSTFWLQSDHHRLTRVANEARENAASDTEVMARLERWARRQMKSIDFAGHFSAVEALSRRAGDCTEGAVVLAALGRAAGIPTRVASGIVYSRERYHGVSHSFTPHAWTLAHVDGEWRSFDMSLDGFDATHIALTISDGDPGSILSAHQLAALLTWDAMTEIKKR